MEQGREQGILSLTQWRTVRYQVILVGKSLDKVDESGSTMSFFLGIDGSESAYGFNTQLQEKIPSKLPSGHL